MEESLEGLHVALKKKDALIGQLKAGLVALRNKALQYQAHIKEHEERVAQEISIAEKTFKDKEEKLIRRCEEAEARILEVELTAAGAQVPGSLAAAGHSRQALTQQEGLVNCLECKRLKTTVLLLQQQTSASRALSHCTPRVENHSKLEETLQAILAHLAKSAKEHTWLREEHALWRETIQSLAKHASIAPLLLQPSQQHEWEPFTNSRGNSQNQCSQEGGTSEKVGSLLAPLQQGAALGEGRGLQGSEASCDVIAHIARPARQLEKRIAGEAIDSHPAKQPKLAAQQAIAAQHQSDREPWRAQSHDQSLTAVDIAQQWLDKLIHSQNVGANALVELVAEGLCSAIVSRQCPVRCLIAGTVSAIIECAALSGLHSGPMATVCDKPASSTRCNHYLGAISMQAGMSIEDLAFCDTWYDEQPRICHAITLVVMCMDCLQKLLKRTVKEIAGGAEVLQELHKELRRCLNLQNSTMKTGACHEAENCALCASLALVCRITGNIQAMRILVWDLTRAKKLLGLHALPPLTAALTVWPEAIETHKQGQVPANEKLLFVQAELKNLCEQALAQTNETRDDVTAHSLETTTTSPTTMYAKDKAAVVLHSLGCCVWHWQ